MAMQHLSACGKKVQGLETILLVEDDETLRKILAGTLQSNGYAVLEAGEARHPNLAPLLLYDGFEGHPGLKSFPYHEYEEW